MKNKNFIDEFLKADLDLEKTIEVFNDYNIEYLSDDGNFLDIKTLFENIRKSLNK